MDRLSNSEERRIFRRLRMFMKDLEWLEKEPVTWDYIRGIYKQAGMLPERMRDTPAETLRKVLQMLDTYIRKICREYGIRPRELPSRAKPTTKPIAINPEAKHLRIGHDLDIAHHAELPF
ncbi:MAG: hypothetical protein EOM20_16620 [Spartobacteria bacterium]|nr:hypothetical protein [Spartobacteria bacterium]